MGEVGQGVRTGLGHGGITCVLQTQFSTFFFFFEKFLLFREVPVIDCSWVFSVDCHCAEKVF